MTQVYDYTANVLKENPGSNRLVAHFTNIGAPDTHAIIPNDMKLSVGDVITGRCAFSSDGELIVHEVTNVQPGKYDLVQSANPPELNSVS
jgi:hypothetical protein